MNGLGILEPFLSHFDIMKTHLWAKRFAKFIHYFFEALQTRVNLRSYKRVEHVPRYVTLRVDIILTLSDNVTILAIIL